MAERLRVVVTRPERQAQHLCELLRADGFDVVAVPVIEILPAPQPDAVAAAIGPIDDYDLLIFISTNAVRFGRDYLPARGPDGPSIAAVGPSTARALKAAQLECDIVPESGFSSEALLGEPALEDVEGKRVLIFRGEGGRALLGTALAERGADVRYAEVYRRRMPDTSRDRLCALLDAQEVDVITATSVETLVNIEQMAGTQRADVLHGIKLLTASARVVKKAAQTGWRRDPILAHAPDDRSLAEAARDWARQRSAPTATAENQGMATDQDTANSGDAGADHDADAPPATGESPDIVEAAADEAPRPAEPGTPDAQPQEPPPAHPKAPKGGRALAGLALLIALGAGALSGYTWWQGRQPPADAGPDPVAAAQAVVDAARRDLGREASALEQRVDARLAAIDLSELQDVADAQAQLERGLRGQERSLATVTGRLTDIENDLATLRGVSASVRNTWVRAEAEYFLQTANSRLQLAKDVDSALQALRAADERIGALGDPGLIPVRARLTEEILAVEGVPRPDVEGMALALNGLAERVLELPLADMLTSRLRAGPDEALDEAQGWDRAKKSVAGVFSQIVRVSPSDGSLAELMAPEQAFFLYRNLEINLQIARLALLQRDTENFRASLRAARDWLTTHFDESDPGVVSSIERLDRMLGVEIDPDIPDISGSLRMLRALVAQSGASQ